MKVQFMNPEYPKSPKLPEQQGNITKAVDELVEQKIILPSERVEIEQQIVEMPMEEKVVLKRKSGIEVTDPAGNFVMVEKKEDGGVALTYGMEIEKKAEGAE